MAKPDFHPAELGLHRGRRLLVALLIGGPLLFFAVAVEHEEGPPPVPPLATMPSTTDIRMPPPPRAPRKRRPQPPPSALARAPEPRVADVLPPPPPLLDALDPVPARLVASEPQLVEESASPAPVGPEPVPASLDAPSTTSEPQLEEQRAPPGPVPDQTPDGNGEAIARAIAASKRAAVRACFESELKQQPALRGNVLVELDLAPPDRVIDVRVSDDLDRPAFTRCVTDEMHRVRFAALDEELSVAVPYVLSPGRK